VAIDIIPALNGQAFGLSLAVNSLERRKVIGRKEAQNPQKIEPDDTEVVPLIKRLIFHIKTYGGS